VTGALLRGLPVFAGDLPPFDTTAAADCPASQFTAWLADAIAAGVPEPHTMTLSLVDPGGRPTARIVILKDVSPDGWDFAGSKGDIAAAALTFYWPLLGRQVRVRGPVAAASAASSAADFLARPPSARAETLVGRQGAPLPSRTDLDLAVSRARARVAADPSLVATSWTRYRLTPTEVEFFQGDPDRMHVRLGYLRTGGTWHRQLRWP
jgi:pyridoxamine 5'-phosphate oxidase